MGLINSSVARSLEVLHEVSQMGRGAEAWGGRGLDPEQSPLEKGLRWEQSAENVARTVRLEGWSASP